jgi:hypothetical protein
MNETLLDRPIAQRLSGVMKVMSMGSLVLPKDDRGSDRIVRRFKRVIARKGNCVEELWINVVKLLRAHGGCLGVRRLRRAWKTAKSSGELSNKR